MKDLNVFVTLRRGPFLSLRLRRRCRRALTFTLWLAFGAPTKNAQGRTTTPSRSLGSPHDPRIAALEATLDEHLLSLVTNLSAIVASLPHATQRPIDPLDISSFLSRRIG